VNLVSGLFDHIVLQRDATNVSDAAIETSSEASGCLFATVVCSGKALSSFDHVLIGEAADGAARGRLAGLPVGGPYQVKLSVETKTGATLDEITANDVLVGRVWVMAGQSNMQGLGSLCEAAKPNPMVHAFYMDDHWDVAADPVNDLRVAIDPVHKILCGGVQPEVPTMRATGPGSAFGARFYELSGVPQGLIASAHGGTCMQQWDPALKSEAGASLYGATLRRVAKNGGRVAGILWYQGCDDATPERSTAIYTERMKGLISAFRADFNAPQLPFVLVQISRFAERGWSAEGWNGIRNQQYALPSVMPNVATVAAIDLPLEIEPKMGVFSLANAA
jgi:sialate O-acetylesterase